LKIKYLIILAIIFTVNCAGKRMGNNEFDNVIVLESPNGGEFIPYGSTVEIKWRSQDVHVVNIYAEKLDKQILPVTEIAHFVPMQPVTTPQNGKFTWYNAGMHTGGPGPYVICLYNGTDKKVYDCSDDVFIIQKPKQTE